MAKTKVALSCISHRFAVDAIETRAQPKAKSKKAKSLFKPASPHGFQTVENALKGTIFKKVVV